MIDKLKSRKLWVTLGSLVVGYFCPELLPAIKFLAPTYVVSQGAVDVASALKAATGK